MLTSHHQGRLRATIYRIFTWHTPAFIQLPRWRHPLVGYLAGFLLVALGLAVGLLERQLLEPFSFPGLPLLFATVLVALFWGAGPAIFTVLLSLLVLDYWYVPPFGTLGSFGWSGILQLLTFASAGVIIALLTNQREVARVRALLAEREALLRANQLEATFEAMNDGVVIYNRQGEAIQTNAAIQRLFGLTALPAKDEARARQELLLQALQCDQYGQKRSEKRRPLARLLAGESLIGTQASDAFVRTPDGRQVILNMSGAPIRSESGTIERAVLIYRDVTERRRLEQRTSEALRALLSMAEVLIQLPEHPQDSDDQPSLSDDERVGQRITELTLSIIESVHVVMLGVDQEEERVYPLASAGFSPQEEEQWRTRMATAPSLVDQLGSPALISQLKDHEILILEGMSLPLHTPVFPYYVQTVLVAPICVDSRLIGLLCIDDGSREHTYTRHEMTLAQTIAGLAALILARAQLQREYKELSHL